MRQISASAVRGQWYNELHRQLRRKFTAGVLVLVPLALTVIALRWLFNLLDGVLSPIFVLLLGRHVPGLGFVAAILLTFLAGAFANSYFGRKWVEWSERVLVSIPFVRRIYNAAKDIVEAFTVAHRGAFKEVVLVQLPRYNVYMLGFMTNRARRQTQDGSERLVNVFIPNVPMPTTGFLILVPEQDVTVLDLTVQEALELVVSGGVVSPELLPVKGSVEEVASSG